MSQKKSNKAPSLQTKQNSKLQPPSKSKQQSQKMTVPKWIGYVFGWRSMLVSIILLLLVYNVVNKNNGYNWVWNGLLKGNWETIKKYPNLTLEERYEMKLGFSYNFLNHINKHTPDTAIILFPEYEYITEKVGNMQLDLGVRNRMWVTHFIYPRIPLYKGAADTTLSIYKNITHVAICAAHGYDDLDYPVYQRSYYDVLPKHAAQDTALQENTTTNKN